MIAPCGLAWQVTRGVTEIPTTCKAAIDEEYGTRSPFTGNLSLPLNVGGLPAALSQLELYRILRAAPVRSTIICVRVHHIWESNYQCVSTRAYRNRTAQTLTNILIKLASISTPWSSSQHCLAPHPSAPLVRSIPAKHRSCRSLRAFCKDSRRWHIRWC